MSLNVFKINFINIYCIVQEKMYYLFNNDIADNIFIMFNMIIFKLSF